MAPRSEPGRPLCHKRPPPLPPPPTVPPLKDMDGERQQVISLKSRAELEKMRVANRLVAQALEATTWPCAPASPPWSLTASRRPSSRGVGAPPPSFKGYRPFKGVPLPPAPSAPRSTRSWCTASGRRALGAGDLISIDWGHLGGLPRRRCVTVPEGDPEDFPRDAAPPGRHPGGPSTPGSGPPSPGSAWGDVSSAIGEVITGHGLLRGRRGLRRARHRAPACTRPPTSPTRGRPGGGPLLRPGMTVALEPMANAGGADTRVAQWTAGRWSPRTGPSAPTSSTPSASPRKRRARREILTGPPPSRCTGASASACPPWPSSAVPYPSPAMAEAPPPDLVEYVGLVSNPLANDLFEVRLADGRLILAHLAPAPGLLYRPPRSAPETGSGSSPCAVRSHPGASRAQAPGA